ncbi:MAG: helix-turn-helix domain-containing protein [Candidatus Nealsonbacteria bacterium]|nr:helix-turn-helix domain-containing protein [Candidatus Nealsonbacteria bacterium]
MKVHYYDPRTQDLVIYDHDTAEISILERIKNIRVFVEKDVQYGDMEQERTVNVSAKLRQAKTKKLNKFTPEKIEELKRLKAEGKTNKELSEHFGVSVPTIWNRLKA